MKKSLNIMIYIYIFSIYCIETKIIYIELIFLILNVMRLKNYNLKRNTYLIWSILVLVSFFISSILSVNIQNSMIIYLSFFKILVIGNVLIQVITEDEVKVYKRAIILAGYLMIIFIILKTPLNLILKTRFGEGVINPNFVAIKLGISSIFYICEKLSNKIRIKEILEWSIFILFIVLTGSRKGLFLIFIGDILSFFYFRYKKSTEIFYKSFKHIPILVITLIIFYKFITLKSILVVNRILDMLSKNNKDESTLVRLEMIDTGVKLFKEKISLGYGLNSYHLFSRFKTYSHNNYIELLVGVGIIGCIIYYLLNIYLVIKNGKYRRQNLQIVPFFVISILIPILDVGLVRYNDRFFNLVIVLNFVILLKIKDFNKKLFIDNLKREKK